MSQYARSDRPAYPSEQPFGGGGLPQGLSGLMRKK